MYGGLPMMGGLIDIIKKENNSMLSTWMLGINSKGNLIISPMSSLN